MEHGETNIEGTESRENTEMTEEIADDPQVLQTVEERRKFERKRAKNRKLIDELENLKITKTEYEQTEHIKADLQKDIDTTTTTQCVDEQNVLTADVFCKEVQIYKKKKVMSEKQEQLCNFAKCHVIEENRKYPLADVKLTIDFCLEGTDNITIIKGPGNQKIRTLFDDKNEPLFRWEKISKRRRFMVYIYSLNFTEHVTDKVTVSFKNGLDALQTAFTAANSFLLTKTVLNSQGDKSNNEPTEKINVKKNSRRGSRVGDSAEMTEVENEDGNDNSKERVTNKGNQKESSETKKSNDEPNKTVPDKNDSGRSSPVGDSVESSENGNGDGDDRSKKTNAKNGNKKGLYGTKKSKL